MLKIKSIASSLILLLFVVTGSYAHTFSNQRQQEKKATEGKQDGSSDEGNSESQPTENAVQLDVFHAISLVNAQLRWKDYHAENSRNSKRSIAAKKQTVEVRQSEERSETFDVSNTGGMPTGVQTPFVSSLWFVSKKTISTYQKCLSAHEQTIDFVLNCGTYPTF